jgi:hypothetical protein
MIQSELGETFEFEGFSFTVGTEINWITVDDEWDRHSGYTYAYIPVIVTNQNRTSQFLPIFRVFAPNDEENDFTSSYFKATNIETAGEIIGGDTVENRYLYILYRGDGIYHVRFGWFEGVEIRVPITR